MLSVFQMLLKEYFHFPFGLPHLSATILKARRSMRVTSQDILWHTLYTLMCKGLRGFWYFSRAGSNSDFPQNRATFKPETWKCTGTAVITHTTVESQRCWHQATKSWPRWSWHRLRRWPWHDCDFNSGFRNVSHGSWASLTKTFSWMSNIKCHFYLKHMAHFYTDPRSRFLQRSTGHTTVIFTCTALIIGSSVAGGIAGMWNNIKELQLCVCRATPLKIPSCATVISTS